MPRGLNQPVELRKISLRAIEQAVTASGKNLAARSCPTKSASWPASSEFNTSSSIPSRTTSCWPGRAKAGRSTTTATTSA